jgi:hypothetical protein
LIGILADICKDINVLGYNVNLENISRDYLKKEEHVIHGKT